jgi:hypothetical protein
MPPFRLDEHRAKIQFLTSARMPSLIYRASVSTGLSSNTEYLQRAVCAAVARDLGLDLDELLSEQPPKRGRAGEFRDHKMPGPANTVEMVT